MSLANNTPYAALAVPYVAPDGTDVVIAIVKASFVRTRDGRLLLADDQRPVLINDVTLDPERDSTVVYPSDVAPAKVGTDVIVVGEAVSKRPVQTMDIAVQVRKHTTLIRVHGLRVYYRSFGRIAIGAAAPFERAPIVYERAYGGHSDDHSIVELRNPVGCGVAKKPADLLDCPAPSIEHPARPIRTADERPEPVGLCGLGTHWYPRAQRAGTYDEEWRLNRMPLMPVDFDLRFYNVAHPSLQLEERLDPGDPVSILGMHQDGLFRVELPDLKVEVFGKTNDGRNLVARPRPDTVLVEPSRDRLELVARHAFPCGRGRTLLREVCVDVAH